MAVPDADLIRCANAACKCLIDPSSSVCSDYCAAVEAWKADEVQNDVCGCGHSDCAAATPQQPHQR